MSAHSVLGMLIGRVWENNSHLLKKTIAGPEENPNYCFFHFLFPFIDFGAAESAGGRFLDCLNRCKSLSSLPVTGHF